MYSFSEKSYLDYENMLVKNKSHEYSITKYPKIKYADNEVNNINDKIKYMNEYFKMKVYIANNMKNVRENETMREKNLNNLRYKLNQIKSIDKNQYPDKRNKELEEYFNLYKKVYDATTYTIDPKHLTNIILEELPIISKKDLPKVKKIKVVKKASSSKDIPDKDISEKTKFQNEDECKTKKRSAKFFYSKEDLIKIIEKDDKIKKKFPKNIKSLSKEEICRIYFS